ncbi:phosphopantetheine-binding protein [Actinocorallia sp. API 0066]|uniref:acyl carrier protein n=1 Tax=Actinocorallia sp. API 0066 TaxID=2896846 RepID=UPI001E4F3BAA|nr:phosphopantetheine-binding protein [Actinocorallia sp. API 0066]MCD0449346.1 phosphopantetheine-binding protein [Actinocorallia sp. API 0066]
MEAVLDRVNALVLKAVPELEPGFAAADSFADVLGVDSLSVVEIMTNVEKEFGFDFEDAEIAHVQNVQDILDAILSRQ